MNLYVSNIEEWYKDTIIVHMGNSDTAYLLLHIVQCWCAWAVNKETQALPMVLYCSHMVYKYYSFIGFPPINTQWGRETIHNEIFNNIPHLSKIICMLIIFKMFFYVQQKSNTSQKWSHSTYSWFYDTCELLLKKCTMRISMIACLKLFS